MKTLKYRVKYQISQKGNFTKATFWDIQSDFEVGDKFLQFLILKLIKANQSLESGHVINNGFPYTFPFNLS